MSNFLIKGVLAFIWESLAKCVDACLHEGIYPICLRIAKVVLKIKRMIGLLSLHSYRPILEVQLCFLNFYKQLGS